MLKPLSGLWLVLLIASCGGGDVRDTLGLSTKAPDEFTVLTHAPLSMPPDYALRPPPETVSDLPRPQVEPRAEAKEALFGNPSDGGASKGAAKTTEGEALFFERLDMRKGRSDIRSVLTRETEGYTLEDKSFVDKLMFWKAGEEESLVDSAKEARRIKENRDAGRPVTAGTVPTVSIKQVP